MPEWCRAAAAYSRETVSEWVSHEVAGSAVAHRGECGAAAFASGGDGSRRIEGKGGGIRQIPPVPWDTLWDGGREESVPGNINKIFYTISTGSA